MTRPSLSLALLLPYAALTLPAAAQRSGGTNMSLTGGAYLLAPGTFAQAFNHGPTMGLVSSAHLVGRLSLRAALRHDWLPYDRARFFRQLGVGTVDLDEQLGGDAQLTTWSVGPELTLWRPRWLRLYSFGTLGRASRSTSTGPLVALYCEPPSVPPGSPASAGCDRAVRETRIKGNGVSLALGAGVRWQSQTRTFLSLEAAYDRELLSPASSGFPIRLGYGITF
jgi:hypothetical protein